MGQIFAIYSIEMKFLIALFFITLMSCSLWAAEVILWKQTPNSANILLPQKENQSKQQALEEYFKAINETPSLNSLLEQIEIKDLVDEDKKIHFKIGELNDLKSSASIKPRFVIVTNELRELFAPPYGRRVANVIKRLEVLGAEVYVLPVMHDLTLDAKVAKSYREKLINMFDAQLVLGGADIDPYLYGEKTTYAKGIVRRRDVSELKFVRQFIEAKKGMNFGICRGHQMCAVANHKKLIQDIQIEEGADTIHLNGGHPINIDETSEVFSVFDKDKILVNSLHHEAVYIPEGDKDYKIIATSMDHNPIVEALEFKNGLGVTLQFHPELMHDETGDKILDQFIKLTIKNKKLQKSSMSCFELMKLFIN
jgi:putative glutamine amidotransferase